LAANAGAQSGFFCEMIDFTRMYTPEDAEQAHVQQSLLC
jgi:hypothetical protein